MFEAEKPAYPFDADAGGGELGDGPQQLDVSVGVAATSPDGPAGRDQAEPLVTPQGLRVEAGQLGGDADDIDGGIGLGGLERVAHAESSNRLARSGLPALAAR